MTDPIVQGIVAKLYGDPEAERMVSDVTADGQAPTLQWRAVSNPQHLMFHTAAEALDYGRGMARNVYGSSVHRVDVESREVGPWRRSVDLSTHHARVAYIAADPAIRRMVYGGHKAQAVVALREAAADAGWSVDITEAREAVTEAQATLPHEYDPASWVTGRVTCLVCGGGETAPQHGAQ